MLDAPAEINLGGKNAQAAEDGEKVLAKVVHARCTESASKKHK